MSAALRLVELVEMDRSTAPTMSPASLAAARPTLRPSMRPTLVPSSTATIHPFRRNTEAPPTQRSATIHPLFDDAARQDAQNLLAVMRVNIEFLAATLHDETSPLAIDALVDIHESITRLERRFT